MNEEILATMRKRMEIVQIPRSAVVNGLSELIAQSLATAGADSDRIDNYCPGLRSFHARRAELLRCLREEFEDLMCERRAK